MPFESGLFASFDVPTPSEDIQFLVAHCSLILPHFQSSFPPVVKSSKLLFGLPATQALSGKAFHSRFSSPLGSRTAVAPLVYYFAAPLCWTPSRFSNRRQHRQHQQHLQRGSSPNRCRNYPNPHRSSIQQAPSGSRGCIADECRSCICNP